MLLCRKIDVPSPEHHRHWVEGKKLVPGLQESGWGRVLGQHVAQLKSNGGATDAVEAEQKKANHHHNDGELN